MKTLKAIGIVAVALATLTGCVKTTAAIDVSADQTANLSLELVDTDGSMYFEDSDDNVSSCETLLNPESLFTPEDYGTVDVEQSLNEDEQMVCRYTATDVSWDALNATGQFRVEADEDGYISLVMRGTLPEGVVPEGMDTSVSFSFPGEVLRATEGGEIQGNTVSWTGEVAAYELAAVARGEAGGIGSDSGTLSLIALVAAVLIFGTAMVVFGSKYSRRKKLLADKHDAAESPEAPESPTEDIELSVEPESTTSAQNGAGEPTEGAERGLALPNRPLSTDYPRFDEVVNARTRRCPPYRSPRRGTR